MHDISKSRTRYFFFQKSGDGGGNAGFFLPREEKLLMGREKFKGRGLVPTA